MPRANDHSGADLVADDLTLFAYLAWKPRDIAAVFAGGDLG